MITFIVIGAIGLLLLLIALPLGDMFDIGDRALSGTSRVGFLFVRPRSTTDQQRSSAPS